MKKKLKFNNNEYILTFDDITVYQSLKIYNQSCVNGQFSDLAAMNVVFDNLNVQIIKNGALLEDPQFYECLEIYKSISNELNANKEDIQEIKEDCINNTNSFEVLLAKNILGGLVHLSAMDFRNMNIKEYEKLIAAIETIKEKK